MDEAFKEVIGEHVLIYIDDITFTSEPHRLPYLGRDQTFGQIQSGCGQWNLVHLSDIH
jgi:hypothetical protein